MLEDTSSGGTPPLGPECAERLNGEILARRGPVRGLSLPALRALLGRVSNRDLAILVRTPPFDRDLLTFLGRGLAPAVFDMLRRDCDRWTGCKPGHLGEAVRALTEALDAVRGLEEPPAPRRPLLARLAGWFRGRGRAASGDSEEPDARPEPEFRPFRLFSATPETFAAFWIPWHVAIRRAGPDRRDWDRLARLCDVRTAGVLRRAGGFRAPEDVARAVAEARAAALPPWTEHVRMAALLGEALLREDDPRILAEALAARLPGRDADGLLAQARERLAAYDEFHPLSQGVIDFMKELGAEEGDDLLRGGESKAPFALSPDAPPPEQAVEILAIRLACRRAGFLFIEEPAKTSGGSALAEVADVVNAVEGGGPDRLARALADAQRRGEAAFGLLETVLAAVLFSTPEKLFQTLNAAAAEPLDPGLLHAPPPGRSACADRVAET